MTNTTTRSTVILMSLVTMRLPDSMPSLTLTSRHCFRLYSDSCKWEDDQCLKDLRLLGIDMAKVFIIDNTPRVLRLHVKQWNSYKKLVLGLQRSCSEKFAAISGETS
ncbi:hypothetical protein VIGAN_07166000 [Vigna angularis var. angularis]|uniref:FCP1 homology domain-containing protein n=1 Tax=Vigna angularis var. angularis TaxID=157739 RepID=A0A0S3SJ55_PHAAN|nr:hypothetical protein VIGAN_07166000 [Vigna angularis var. angularis]